MDFQELKRNRQNLSELAEASKAATGRRSSSDNKDFKDDRFWVPSRDAQGQGYAVIRFLPGTDEKAATSWIRFWEHSFQGPTGLWYIEKSLTSIGKEDPLGEMNSRLWNTGVDADKALARSRARRLRFVANILVVSDPSHPENNGQVKLYKFGTKIMGKITDKLEPPFPDEEPINPFDMWDGADFVVKIRKVDGFPNYDTSTFKPAAPISADDKELEAIYNKQHDLSEFLDPKNYPSYAELKAKLDRVLGNLGEPKTIKEAISLDTGQEVRTPPPPPAPTPVAAAAVEEEDDDMDETFRQFEKLAAGS